MRVPIVEDHRRLSAALARSLAGADYAVDAAHDGVEGKQLTAVVHHALNKVVCLPTFVRQNWSTCRGRRSQQPLATAVFPAVCCTVVRSAELKELRCFQAVKIWVSVFQESGRDCRHKSAGYRRTSTVRCFSSCADPNRGEQVDLSIDL
jgi:hypothetical protein